MGMDILAHLRQSRFCTVTCNFVGHNYILHYWVPIPLLKKNKVFRSFQKLSIIEI